VALDVQLRGTATVSAMGPQDLVLMVRHPDGTFSCDDDSGGNTDPRLVLDLPAGPHEVWVGTYSAFIASPFDLRVDFAPVLDTPTDDP
jgi:hypothetical protein